MAKKHPTRGAEKGDRGAPDEKVIVRHDGRGIMAKANGILKAFAPEVPEVPSPGRGLLVIALYEAQQRGHDVTLDYREYDACWQIFEKGSISGIKPAWLPFTIIATGSSVIEIHFGDFEEITLLLPVIWKLFNEPRILNEAAPYGFSEPTHRTLCRVASSLQAPWSRGMLVRRANLEWKEADLEGPSDSHIRAWLKAMVDRGEIFASGPDHHPRYSLIPPPSAPIGQKLAR